MVSRGKDDFCQESKWNLELHIQRAGAVWFSAPELGQGSEWGGNMHADQKVRTGNVGRRLRCSSHCRVVRLAHWIIESPIPALHSLDDPGVGTWRLHETNVLKEASSVRDFNTDSIRIKYPHIALTLYSVSRAFPLSKRQYQFHAPRAQVPLRLFSTSTLPYTQQWLFFFISQPAQKGCQAIENSNGRIPRLGIDRVAPTQPL